MDIVFYQQVSLYISLLTILAMILLGIVRKKARLFYFSMLLGWLPGLVYYVSVLYFYNEFFNYFGIPAIDVSAMLRTYQYSMFGAWFIFDALCVFYDYLRINRTYTKLFDVIEELNKRAKSEKNE
jgi:hypothetical protein